MTDRNWTEEEEELLVKRVLMKEIEMKDNTYWKKISYELEKTHDPDAVKKKVIEIIKSFRAGQKRRTTRKGERWTPEHMKSLVELLFSKIISVKSLSPQKHTWIGTSKSMKAKFRNAPRSENSVRLKWNDMMGKFVQVLFTAFREEETEPPSGSQKEQPSGGDSTSTGSTGDTIWTNDDRKKLIGVIFTEVTDKKVKPRDLNWKDISTILNNGMSENSARKEWNDFVEKCAFVPVSREKTGGGSRGSGEGGRRGGGAVKSSGRGKEEARGQEKVKAEAVDVYGSKN